MQREPRIPAYSNYLFCVKTEMSAKGLAELFADAAVSGFLVVEIDPMNMNGKLQRAAWEWFKDPVEAEAELAPGFREP